MAAAVPRRLPDSKDAIRAALARLKLHPHKRFGQHFLGDAAVLDRIVSASGAGLSSVVLEVGPGLGALTERLLATGAAVVAVEIDHGLARMLRDVLDGEDLALLEQDVMARKGRIAAEVASALRAAQSRRGAPGFEVVSNLPYGISSPFLGSLMSEPGPPLRATLMVQSEFAAALAAKPSSEEYSALSVFARVFFSVKRAFDVGRHAFFPQPDVDSSVVTLVPLSRADVDADAFSRFTQKLFQGRRKAVSTTVRALLPAEAGASRDWLVRAGFDPMARVDAMEPERIVELFRRVVSSHA